MLELLWIWDLGSWIFPPVNLCNSITIGFEAIRAHLFCRVSALCLLAALASTGHSALPTRDGARDVIVILHGMGRTRLSMKWLADRFHQQGYEVLNLAYPSTRRSIAELSGQLHRELQNARVAQAGRIHFVTHSAGGIVVRAYLKEHQIVNLGRVVMLSPPNQGSEVADRLRNNFVYQWATGPAGQELGTGEASVPNALGAVNFPLGVITGNKSFNPLFSAWISGPDDGKVSVERARVEFMSDFLIVPHTHSFIMRSPKVAAQAVHFLEHGQFEHPGK
jgi:triacylglycerol lipase